MKSSSRGTKEIGTTAFTTASIRKIALRIQQEKERKELEERARSTQISSGRMSKRNSKYND